MRQGRKVECVPGGALETAKGMVSPSASTAWRGQQHRHCLVGGETEAGSRKVAF